MSGAHTQVLGAQNPHVPLKEPSSPLLPVSDLGAPGVPGTFLRLSLILLCWRQICLTTRALVVPTGLPYKGLLAIPKLWSLRTDTTAPALFLTPLGSEETLPKAGKVAPRGQGTVPVGSLTELWAQAPQTTPRWF